MADRKPISPEVQTRLLTSSARRCCICFGVNRDFAEKRGQIAHIDQNPSNPDFDNLAYLCFDHHDQYDSKTKQSKNLTQGEIKHYRDMLNQAVEQWRKDGIEPTLNEPHELKFDAGLRVKQVREELNLKTSQFAELISVASQREYEAMENREKEFSLSLLKKVSDISGVNLEWLKHEKGRRYTVENIYFRPVEEDLQYCAGLNPREYFLTVDAKDPYHVGLVAQIDAYRYQVIATGITLDFGHWVEGHWAAPRFYEFLKRLSDPWHDIEGVVLPTKYEKSLYEGDIHFLTARGNANRYGGDLLYDILDVDETRKKPFLTYSKAYGGNWMHKAHEGYKKILAAIALDKEFENAIIANFKNSIDKGFDGAYFQNEIKHNGGVFAVKRLFYKKEGVTQLKKLQEMDLLDQSMEALVIQEHFQPLFTNVEIAEAYRRLEELGYFKKGR